jgi:class 3 adenylate cyclase
MFCMFSGLAGWPLITSYHAGEGGIARTVGLLALSRRRYYPGVETPTTQYARNGDVHLAFQVLGEGPLDLLLVDTWVHHVEAVWDLPDLARFLRRLSSFGRLIHFDRRGTGLSDPVPVDKLPDLETQAGDATAVLEAAGSEGAAVIGLNDGCIVAVLLAARQPQLCRSLVLYTMTRAHTLAGGMPMESIDEVIKMMEARAAANQSSVEFVAPSRANDERFDRELARLQRFSLRPGVLGHYYRQTMEAADVGDLLPSIRVPTLVLNRTGNRIVPVEESREAAAAIENARFVELPGTDHLAFSEGIDGLLDEVEEFLTGTRTGDPDRVLTTMLFTDIVDSTGLAARIGDRTWRDVLERHHQTGRRQLERFGGREISTTGDGFFASFDRPISAVRCALAMVEEVRPLGLEIRAGVHTGEVEVRGSYLEGLAVHITARISALAGTGEVLVSGTVKDLLAGSGLVFDDRSEHELKGVPGTWRLYAALPDGTASRPEIPSA